MPPEVMHATIAEQTLLYVPAGFVLAERTGSTAAVVGMRVGLVAADGKAGDRLLPSLTYRQSKGIPQAPSVTAGMNDVVKEAKRLSTK